MKNLLILLTVLICTNVFSQKVSMSSDYIYYYQYNKEAKDYDYLTKENSPSFFFFSEDKTMFTHKTKDATSSYAIVYVDEENNTKHKYGCIIESDTGNSYYFVIDSSGDSTSLMFINMTKGSLAEYVVKNIW